LIQLLLQLKKGQSIQSADDITQPTMADTGFAIVEESEIGKRTDKRQWNDEELMAQCFVFFLAGFETASTLLSFTAYELALNTDVQEMLFNEVKATNSELDGKNLTYEALQKMKYLDMVISEALRKWPNSPFIDRLCVKNYKLKYGQYDFIIEKGKFCWIPIYALHFDEQYFPNPQKFDPERFSDDNKKKINTGAYLPFGIGPRNCIGSRFALMESKAVIYYMILNFHFEITAKTQMPLKITKGMAGFGAENGIHLRLRPRQL
jgi:cytochrome P450 family 9